MKKDHSSNAKTVGFVLLGLAVVSGLYLGYDWLMHGNDRIWARMQERSNETAKARASEEVYNRQLQRNRVVQALRDDSSPHRRGTPVNVI